jgi:ADP-ribosylglycohydrolase
MGSMGNGGAMRVAPLGAYFSDDIQTLIEEARKSAEVTHAHAEGQAGAIAIALAAAFAWNERKKLNENTGTKLIEFVLEHTPEGETREGIRKALGLERSLSVQTAVSFLGNGSRVISQDTVPFSLWCAARHLNNFCGAMWTTVSGLGDRDTNCAIVGGIVALSAGAESIPADWVQAREPLKF